MNLRKYENWLRLRGHLSVSLAWTFSRLAPSLPRACHPKSRRLGRNSLFPSTIIQSHPMVILYILFVCLSLFFPTVVRADTEAITFTSPFLSSKAGLIRPRATHSISLGQQHIRLEAFEDGSLRQPWLLLAPPETNALHEPGSWMLRVSWLAQVRFSSPDVAVNFRSTRADRRGAFHSTFDSLEPLSQYPTGTSPLSLSR